MNPSLGSYTCKVHYIIGIWILKVNFCVMAACSTQAIWPQFIFLRSRSFSLRQKIYAGSVVKRLAFYFSGNKKLKQV